MPSGYGRKKGSLILVAAGFQGGSPLAIADELLRSPTAGHKLSQAQLFLRPA
jgi:hypothetical protein